MVRVLKVVSLLYTDHHDHRRAPVDSPEEAQSVAHLFLTDRHTVAEEYRIVAMPDPIIAS